MARQRQRCCCGSTGKRKTQTGVAKCQNNEAAEIVLCKEMTISLVFYLQKKPKAGYPPFLPATSAKATLGLGSEIEMHLNRNLVGGFGNL